MRAGTLRERIAFQRKSTASTQAWGQSTGWDDLLTNVPASVVPDAVSEEVVAKGAAAMTTYTIKIRYRKNLTPQDRIIWCGKTLDIVGMIDVGGRKRELVITAVEHKQNV